jgi:CRISPR-associated endonuclease/helicase Cas3
MLSYFQRSPIPPKPGSDNFAEKAQIMSQNLPGVGIKNGARELRHKLSEGATRVETPKPPCNLPFWIAHTPSKQNPYFHSLKKHILRVSEMARDFAVPLGASEIAYFLGLLHDLGKFRYEFQEYLHECYQAEKKHQTPPPPGSAPHKQAGALAVETLAPDGWGRFLSLPLFGHHGGMLSPSETARKVAEKTTDAEVEELLERAVTVDARLQSIPPDIAPLQAFAEDPFALEMYVRLIYSCLVDADALDTEAHNDPEAAQRRAETSSSSLRNLYELLQTRQQGDFAGKTGAVNEVRREVYAACLQAAQLPPGVFELTVPTGGGKTRSSLAFALAHAVEHGLRRVIYAIPYTSIVDQTTAVFRDLFGSASGVLLEHHSAIDVRTRPTKSEEEDDAGAKEAERWRRLATQNWDGAALIVTTTVQLFESLFSNRPSACRKLHRLAGSVIVLDEAQCLPLHLMAPLRSGLKTLVEHFGVTVVFCTATQPAHDVTTPFLEGLNARPIIPDARRDAHFDTLKRVHFRVKREAWSWEQVAEEMQNSAGSCLCVVNTRHQAIDLLDILDRNGANDEVLHLSTLLCGRHRKDVQQAVALRLEAERQGSKQRVLLVSTQVIEAGVDLDFPKAMRAVGPLDRIIQAAGRCNREGLRPRDASEVIIFKPEDGASPQGIYRMALERTQRLFGGSEDVDLDDPTFVTDYFRQLYADLAMDRKQVGGEIQSDRQHLRYDEVAQKMRLIEDDTISVFVDAYESEEAQAVLSEAERLGRMTRGLWQRAQPFCVALRVRDTNSTDMPIDEPVPGLRCWRGTYDAKRGIPLDKGIADLALDPKKLLI